MTLNLHSKEIASIKYTYNYTTFLITLFFSYIKYAFIFVSFYNKIINYS